MSTNNFFNDLYKDIFSLNSLYEIVRNIFTVIVIGIALYIFLEIYPTTSESLLLFLLALVGVVSYFFLPVAYRIPMLIITYPIRAWSAESELQTKRERINAETINVQFCANKYRREIERYKEILALSVMAMEKGQVELKDQEGVLETVAKAEEDLLFSVEKANVRLADYNVNIDASMFRRWVRVFSKEIRDGGRSDDRDASMFRRGGALDRVFSEERYDNGRLVDINRKLDECLGETKALEEELDEIKERFCDTDDKRRREVKKVMPKRKCDVCGNEKEVRGGKVCSNGHFICEACYYRHGSTRCPLCGVPLR